MKSQITCPTGRRANYKSQILLFVLLGALLLPLASFAQGLVPCGPGTPKPQCQLCDIFVLFKNIVDFLLIPRPDINKGVPLVPVIAVFMITLAGFMFVLAYAGGTEIAAGGQKGGPAMLSKAKQTLTYTIIGLIIIYAAWLIVSLFFMAIGVLEWTRLRDGGWSIIDCP